MAKRTTQQPRHGKTAIMLSDFSKPSTLAGWRVVNDGVMGGRSRSTIRVTSGHALFAGDVSAENNGGFASVRAPVFAGVTAGYDAISMRVRGDGKRYQLRVRMDHRWDGPAYKHPFVAPAGQWQEVELSFAAFEATFRGRPVPGAPPLDAGRIQQVGFLIADKQLGPFKLEVEWIKAVRRASP